MKIENSKGVEVGKETKTGGFELHAPGRFLFQIDDVEFRINKETGARTYFVKMKSVDALDGADDGSVNKPYTHIANVLYTKDGEEKVNSGGEREMFAFCTHTGVQGDLEAKFSGDETYAHDKVAFVINQKLPDKFIGLAIEHKQTTKNGKEQINAVTTGIFAVGAVKNKADRSVSPKTEENSNGDW